jgi:hypothetical protein
VDLGLGRFETRLFRPSLRCSVKIIIGSSVSNFTVLCLLVIIVVAAGTCAFEFLPPTKHSSLLGFVLAQQPLQIVGVAWVLLFIVAKSVVG